MNFVFVSFLFLLIFGSFGYPELKKRGQANTPEGDTHITRDLGIPCDLTFLVRVSLDLLSTLQVCFAFLSSQTNTSEGDTQINRDLGILLLLVSPCPKI